MTALLAVSVGTLVENMCKFLPQKHAQKLKATKAKEPQKPTNQNNPKGRRSQTLQQPQKLQNQEATKATKQPQRAKKQKTTKATKTKHPDWKTSKKRKQRRKKLHRCNLHHIKCNVNILQLGYARTRICLQVSGAQAVCARSAVWALPRAKYWQDASLEHVYALEVVLTRLKNLG